MNLLKLIKKISNKGVKGKREKDLEGKIKVYSTNNGALYIKVEELFAQKKVQEIIDKSLTVKVVGYRKVK
jgi:hypothetical protein